MMSFIVPPTGGQGEGTPIVSAAIAERLLSEGLITLADAAKLLPPTREGKPVSKSALFRWATRGKHGVRLEAIRLSGPGLFTSRPAIARFAAALTARGG